MLSKCSQFFQRSASGRNVIILLFVAIASMWLMAAVITPAFQDATNDLRPFDLNLGITAEIMYRDLPAYTERSRRLYVWFAIVDYIYPAAVAAFFSLLWAWIFNKVPTPFFDRLRAAGILIFPFLYALVDWLENAGFLFVIFGYPGEYPVIANLAGTLKQMKPFVLLSVVALTVLLTVTGVWQARRRSH
jgi:hypothetical protein